MEKSPARKRRVKKGDYRMRTHLIHGNYDSDRWDYDHHVIPPISSTTAFRLNSAQRGAQGFIEFGHEELMRKVPIYIYDRLDEPTRGMLEENLAYVEEGETCVTFATGMAAISAALGVLVTSGQSILAHQTLYGCTYSLLSNWYPRYNIGVDFCDLTRVESLQNLIRPETRLIYFETPVNPTMQLIDIGRVARMVADINTERKEADRIVTVVDNTFATPYCQRPIRYGADIVIHSLTKDIGGFGTDMGGAVIAPRKFFNHLVLYRKDFGGVLASRNAWAFLVYGLPTLATRMVNQQKTALKVAEFLESHPKVERVLYPGLESFPQRDLARRQMISYEGKFAPGSILYFVLKVAKTNAEHAVERFVNYIAENAYSITLAVSLGQIKTLIESPNSMTHSALPESDREARGLEPGGVRLSIGLEDWHDIIEDLSAGLNQI
ncbi:MAG: PLP-dependent transferase [Acidobacteria bacterium]|nr:PLP-dependent transferase [Acidobacteriota bacterium]MBI3655608.1 PLP-dependent transferase [Acidobacteriota bacterium]